MAWQGGDYMYVCIIPQNIGLNDANPKLSIRKELIISHVVYCHMLIINLLDMRYFVKLFYLESSDSHGINWMPVILGHCFRECPCSGGSKSPIKTSMYIVCSIFCRGPVVIAIMQG